MLKKTNRAYINLLLLLIEFCGVTYYPLETLPQSYTPHYNKAMLIINLIIQDLNANVNIIYLYLHNNKQLTLNR